MQTSDIDAYERTYRNLCCLGVRKSYDFPFILQVKVKKR